MLDEHLALLRAHNEHIQSFRRQFLLQDHVEEPVELSDMLARARLAEEDAKACQDLHAGLGYKLKVGARPKSAKQAPAPAPAPAPANTSANTSAKIQTSIRAKRQLETSTETPTDRTKSPKDTTSNTDATSNTNKSSTDINHRSKRPRVEHLANSPATTTKAFEYDDISAEVKRRLNEAEQKRAMRLLGLREMKRSRRSSGFSGDGEVPVKKKRRRVRKSETGSAGSVNGSGNGNGNGNGNGKAADV